MVEFEKSEFPLSLINCQFDAFAVEWATEDKKLPPFPDKAHVTASIEHMGQQEGNDVWVVEMDVSSYDPEELPDEDENDGDMESGGGSSMLFFDMGLTGIFASAIPDRQHDIAQVHAVIATEAAHMLFGIARERLAQSTFGSEYGPYYLPAVNLFIRPQEIKALQTGKNSSDKKHAAPDKDSSHLKIVKG